MFFDDPNGDCGPNSFKKYFFFFSKSTRGAGVCTSERLKQSFRWSSWTFRKKNNSQFPKAGDLYYACWCVINSCRRVSDGQWVRHSLSSVGVRELQTVDLSVNASQAFYGHCWLEIIRFKSCTFICLLFTLTETCHVLLFARTAQKIIAQFCSSLSFSLLLWFEGPQLYCLGSVSSHLSTLFLVTKGSCLSAPHQTATADTQLQTNTNVALCLLNVSTGT